MLIRADSAVSRRTDPKVVVTSAAYLLFYRRRSTVPLGGPFFERLIAAADAENSESQPTSRAPSPAGEGKRLDDSSRIGSSSALRGVEAAHQAGGGGSAHGTGVPTVRTGIDDDDPADALPGYSAQDPRGTLDPRGLQEGTLESMEVDDDEGIGMDEGLHYHGPFPYSSYRSEEPTWGFGSNGQAPSAPPASEEEDLFADDSSTKVAKSSVSDSLENRMADFNDDEGTTDGPFSTPPRDDMSLLDIPPHMDEEDEPVAMITIDDEFGELPEEERVYPTWGASD